MKPTRLILIIVVFAVLAGGAVWWGRQWFKRPAENKWTGAKVKAVFARGEKAGGESGREGCLTAYLREAGDGPVQSLEFYYLSFSLHFENRGRPEDEYAVVTGFAYGDRTMENRDLAFRLGPGSAPEAIAKAEVDVEGMQAFKVPPEPGLRLYKCKWRFSFARLQKWAALPRSGKPDMEVEWKGRALISLRYDPSKVAAEITQRIARGPYADIRPLSFDHRHFAAP